MQPDQPTRRLRPWLMRAVQIVLFALIAWFIAQYLRDQVAQIQDTEFNPDGWLLGLAQLCFVLGLLGQPFGSWLVLRALGHPLKKVDVWQIFFVGLVAKYLPGSIWALPSRGYLYTQHGVPAGHSLLVVFWESTLMVFGAVAVGTVGISALSGSVYLWPVVLFLSVSSIGLMVGGTILQSHRWRDRLAALPLIGRVFKILPLADQPLTLRQLLLISGYYALDWLVMGAGLAGLVMAFKPDLTLIE